MTRPDWHGILDHLRPFVESLCSTIARAARGLWHLVTPCVRRLWGLARTHRRVAIPLACVLALALVGTAYAWLTRTSALDNAFDLRDVQPAVEETLESGTKSDVKVRNDGKVASYLRCQVEVYWRDADGNRLWEVPALATDGTSSTGDYTLTMATSATAGTASSWVQGSDGFWYWTSPVGPGEETGVLITTAQQLKAYDATATGASATSAQLVVDVSTQAIQADDAKAAAEAWGATVAEDRTLTPRAGS